MCDDKGNIIGIVLIAKDITERKQMEEALHHNEEHLRSITENVLDIITVIDKYGTINYESPSVERVLGYKPEELIGGNAFDLIYPEDIPAVMGAITEGTHNPGSPQSIDYRFKHKNGSWRILESVGKVIIDKAGTIEIIPVAPDLLTGMDCSQSAQQIKHMFIDPEGFVARIGTLLTNRQTVNDEVLDLADGRRL